MPVTMMESCVKYTYFLSFFDRITGLCYRSNDADIVYLDFSGTFELLVISHFDLKSICYMELT